MPAAIPASNRRNDYLVCAVRTLNRPSEIRIEMLRPLLEDQATEPVAILAEMDAVIQEFQQQVEHYYHFYMEQRGNSARYHDSLHTFVERTYPWISAETYGVLVGALSYR